MSRDGLTRADMDTAKLSDPKVLALARLLHDSLLTAAAVTLHEAVLLASWREGERLALPDCLPGWWVDELDDRLVPGLIAVGLLDAEQRLPEHAFESWYRPAAERMGDAQRRRIFGGLVSRGMSREEANREADRRARNRPKAEPKAGQLKAELPPIHPSTHPPTGEVDGDPADVSRADPAGPPAAGRTFRQAVPFEDLDPAIQDPEAARRVQRAARNGGGGHEVEVPAHDHRA